MSPPDERHGRPRVACRRPPWRSTLAAGLLVLALCAPGRAIAASEIEPVVPCEGDACAPIPTPPEDPQPATLVGGPGNPAPHYQKPGAKRPSHRHHHHHHHRGRR